MLGSAGSIYFQDKHSWKRVRKYNDYLIWNHCKRLNWNSNGFCLFKADRNSYITLETAAIFFLIKQYEVSLSQMLNDILWPDDIQWKPPTDQTLYRNRPFTEFWVVSIEHLRRVWHVDRGSLLLRTPGPVPLGLAYVLLVETNPFSELVVTFRTMLFEYPSVLSRFCF